MRTSGTLAVISLLGLSRALAQPVGSQQPTLKNPLDGDKSGAWLFPVESLNDTLPRWLRFGGEFRSRIESEDGIGYTTTNDTYLLSRFRFDVTIQPAKWLSFFGETQDARVLFKTIFPMQCHIRTPGISARHMLSSVPRRSGRTSLPAARFLLSAMNG